jgi:hypothetical protein
LVVRPAETASADEQKRLSAVFSTSKPPFEGQREGEAFLVFVGEREMLNRVEAAVMRTLAKNALAPTVVTPLPVGRWDEALDRYLVVDITAARLAQPAVLADQIGWLVCVRPASAFDWRATRAALMERGRTTLRETEQGIEVGAHDEADAQELIRDLATVSAVRTAEARPLGRLRRWKVRQQLLGNYSDFADPTQPP